MPIKLPSFRPRRDVYPPDLWTKCPSCSEMLFNKQLEKADRVCPTCDHHFRLSAAARLGMLVDPGTFIGAGRGPPIGRPARLRGPEGVPGPRRGGPGADRAPRRRGARFRGRSRASPCRSASWTSGSWAARWARSSARRSPAPPRTPSTGRIPLVVVSASGGARMQEGTLALMQLAKTCAILERVRAARVPYVSVMSDPTTGGVFASYAVLGDVNLAEPNALIGFAGARVAAGTIAQELPAGLPAQRVPVRARVHRSDRPSTRAPRRDREPPAVHARAGARPRRGRPPPARSARCCRPWSAWRAGRRRLAVAAGGIGCAVAGAVGGAGNGNGNGNGEVTPMVDRLLGRQRREVRRPRTPTPPTRRPRCGAASSSPATSAARARSTCSTRWPTRSSSSTAIAASATTRRWSRASRASTAGGSRSSGSRRAPTRTRTSGATSGCPIPRATARRCGSSSSPSASTCRSSPSSTCPARTPARNRRSAASPRRSPARSG